MIQTGDIVALMADVSAMTAGMDGSENGGVDPTSSIFALCQQLQATGPHLEQTHEAELSRVFAALRQACCRDSGDQQLGVACRRRVMELIELRAMGWRPKLSHTQYYLTRNNSDNNSNNNNNNQNNDRNNNEALDWKPYKSRNDPEYKKLTCPLISELPTAKEIAARETNKPPTDFVPSKNDNNGIQLKNNSNFNNNNNNNNNFNNNNNNTLLLNCQRSQRLPPATFNVPPPPPPSLFLTSPSLEGVGPTPNGYFVIPATSNWPTTAVQMMSAAAAAAAAIYPPPPPPPLMSTPPPFFRLPNGAPMSMAPINLSTISGILNAKSIKSQQFREEVVIRNSDSGKIMGVKGRRVALIEELSRTVISFQKIDSKCRDRVLTVTGSTPESIREARRFIDETIRRNISPTPAGRSPLTAESVSSIALAKAESTHSNQPAEGARETFTVAQMDSSNDAVAEEPGTPAGVSIQRSADGSLRLCCDDQKVLEAAQTALCEYLNRIQPSRNSVDASAESKVGSDSNDHPSNDGVNGNTMPLRYTRDEILAFGSAAAAPLSEAMPVEILRYA